MTKAADIIGEKFNLLTVVKRVENNKRGQARWECLCDCGNTTYVSTANLKSGAVKSCGCLRDVMRHRTHGMSKTRLYWEWAGIKARCTYASSKDYEHYGKRGITMCKEWETSFAAFKDWALSNGYNDGLTIERIDVNGNYCPENCTWIPKSEQSKNRRSCVMITYNGKTQSLMEWANELCLNYKRIHNRMFKLGWDFERAISEPVNINKRNLATRMRGD